jgi:RHS repeat-associated protein
LTATVGGVTWTYRYDPFGRRYSKTASTGATTIYLPDENNNEVGEYDGVSGLTLRENVFDPRLVAPVVVLSYTNGASAVAVFNHADRLGSVVATSSAPSPSSNGVLMGQYKYDAWGQSATLAATGFGYAGYRYDAETGLYYARARYYDPRLGRFLSTDPLGQGPGLNV